MQLPFFVKMDEAFNQINIDVNLFFNKAPNSEAELKTDDLDIGYMAITGEVFWASRDAVVLVGDGPSTFFSGERRKK